MLLHTSKWGHLFQIFGSDSTCSAHFEDVALFQDLLASRSSDAEQAFAGRPGSSAFAVGPRALDLVIREPDRFPPVLGSYGRVLELLRPTLASEHPFACDEIVRPDSDSIHGALLSGRGTASEGSSERVISVVCRVVWTSVIRTNRSWPRNLPGAGTGLIPRSAFPLKLFYTKCIGSGGPSVTSKRVNSGTSSFKRFTFGLEGEAPCGAFPQLSLIQM
jgi:hypothetical protein